MRCKDIHQTIFPGMCLPWTTALPLMKLPEKLLKSVNKAGFKGPTVTLEDIVPYSKLQGLTSLDRARHVFVDSQLGWNNIPKLLIEVTLNLRTFCFFVEKNTINI